MDNLRDVRLFGPRILLRHLPRRKFVDVRLHGTRPIRLRVGSSDLWVFRQVFFEPQYSLGDSTRDNGLEARYAKILMAGGQPLILDLGANVGSTALWYSHRFPGALIVAVEPDPANAALCRRNTDGAHVTVIEGAVGGSAGFVQLDRSGGTDWAVRTERSPHGTVRIFTVAELLDEFAHAEPFIAKIDIEGFELDVFNGNAKWIDRMSAIVLEPHDWMLPGSATSRPFQREMAQRNLDIMISGENLVYLNRDLCPYPGSERTPSPARTPHTGCDQPELGAQADAEVLNVSPAAGETSR